MSSTSTIDVSSTTTRSPSSGWSWSFRKPPFLGSTSSSRWIVFASRPVASLRRLAARPVGAQSSTRAPFAARMRRIAVMIVVLPTPGPPVTTRTFETRASRTAIFWLSASSSPVFPSTQGIALSGSIAGHAGRPAPSTLRRSAIACSARCRPPRKRHSVVATVSATTVPAATSCRSALSTRGRGTSSSVSARGTNSSTGNPQWPSSSASVRA